MHISLAIRSEDAADSHMGSAGSYDDSDDGGDDAPCNP